MAGLCNTIGNSILEYALHQYTHRGPCNPYPLPSGFFTALSAVAPFSADGLIHFGAGVMQSHASADVGACYSLEGLPKGPVFFAKQLALLKPYMQTVDFLAPGPEGTTMLMFFGDKIRGLITGMRQ